MARQSTKPPLETLQAELADPDYKVRKEAIKQIMRYHRAQACEPLIKMLEDTRGDVRATAVQALGKLKDTHALLPILGLLTDKNTLVRAWVARALGNFGDRSVTRPLLQLLSDPDPRLRMYAARSLAQLGDPNSLPAVLAYFEQTRKTGDGTERYHAARALADFDLPAVIEPLLALYQPQAGENIFLASGYWLLAEVLSKLGPRTQPTVLEILVDQGYPGEVRACVAEALARKPQPTSLQPLIAALNDDNADVRANAAEALAKLRDPQAIEPLLRLLEDPREKVLIAAIKALRDLHATIAIDRLLDLLASRSVAQPEAYTVLHAIIEALGKLGNARAIKPLLNAFWQPLHYVCLSEIAKTLCKLNDPTAVEPLLQHSLAFEPTRRSSTLNIIEHFRDPRAVDSLLALLDPQAVTWPEINRQERIIRLLAILQDARAIEPLRIYAQNTTNRHHFAALSALDTLNAVVSQ